jgi:hypothetical protein
LLSKVIRSSNCVAAIPRVLVIRIFVRSTA